MKTNSRLLSIAVLSLCVAPIALAGEKKISQSRLPPAVQKTAQDLSKGAIVRAYMREDENGQTVYEVEMTRAAIQKTYQSERMETCWKCKNRPGWTLFRRLYGWVSKPRAGKGSITKIESITKHGEIVAYEAQVRTGSKRSEIQVGPDGLPLSHEE